ELIFALFPYPGRLRALVVVLLAYVKTGLRWLLRALGLYKLLPRRLAQFDELLPPLSAHQVFARLPALTPAQGERRARVALVAGCVQRVFFPGVNEATVRVLSAEGCEVLVPEEQGCCGALSMHAGREEESLRFARALVERFSGEPVDAVVINAAGCGSHLKDYARLFPDDARARAFAATVLAVIQLLAVLPPRSPPR